jgi:hypothetical protein
MAHLVPQNEKVTPAAKTSFVPKKRAEKSEERSLIKKRGFAIRSGESFN